MPAGAIADTTPEEVVVTGASHANAPAIYPDDVKLLGASTVADVLNEVMPSAAIADTEANPFQMDLVYRGFVASPVLGSEVGLAVYEGGDRINEAFGDTVLWDMVPLFAVDRIDVVPGSDPVLGLNALGGAVALDMKTGFEVEGDQVEFAAGSFGRASVTGQTSHQWEDEALYAGVSAVHDDGWRRSSPSNLLQTYADYSWRSGRGSAAVTLSYATDKLSENAAVPVQDDLRAAFAIPDIARDTVLFLQARGAFDVDSATMLRMDAFLRSTRIGTLNGQPSGFSPCASNPLELCNGGVPLVDLGGNAVPASAIGNGTLGVQATRTLEVGTTAQLEWNGTLFSLENNAVVGAAFDHAPTDFDSSTLLGVLLFEPGGVTTVSSEGIFLGGDAWNTRLHTTNTDAGIFAEDALAIASGLELKLAGRWNFDRIDLTDRFGAALTGDHAFSGFNPSARLSWSPASDTHVYAEIGQSNRTPTAAELSCANPTQPCLFPLGFISDPELRQVVAQTVEAGVDGKSSVGSVALSWMADAYDTRNRHDILFISAGPFVGSGYFANIGDTERRGAEARLSAAWRDFDTTLNYGFVDPTFRTAFFEPSPHNPGANKNGEIFVERGDRLPNIPQHTIKLALGWRPISQLYLKLEMDAASGQYLRGDEANLQPQLPGYAVFDVETQYRLSDTATISLRAQNIFDKRYSTFGLFGDPTANGTFPQFTNPRFVVPAQPFGLWGGLKVAW